MTLCTGEAESHCATFKVLGPAGAFICRWHGDCRLARACQTKSEFCKCFCSAMTSPVPTFFFASSLKQIQRHSVIVLCHSVLFSLRVIRQSDRERCSETHMQK